MRNNKDSLILKRLEGLNLTIRLMQKRKKKENEKQHYNIIDIDTYEKL